MVAENDNTEQPKSLPVFTDDIVEEVCVLLAYRHRKHAIKARLEKQLEMEIRISVFEHIMREAKKRMIDRSKAPREETKCTAVEFYESLINNEDVPANIRLKAQERLDAIFGHESTGDDMSDDDRASLARQALAEAKEGVDGSSDGTVE